MVKKSFVKYLALEICAKHNREVEIIYDAIDEIAINMLIIDSKEDNIVRIISRNPKTEHLFRDDKVVIIIHSGKGIFANRDIHVDFMFNDDKSDSCGICLDVYRKNGSRQCERCHKSFCVKCQIRLMICAFISAETGDDYRNTMTCPYCKFEHFGNIPIEDFIDLLGERCIQEIERGVLTLDETEELFGFFDKQINDDILDADFI
jgi:hypothetical protein